MRNQLLAIKDIDPSTKQWTSNVMVIEKSFPRTGSSGIIFQKLMLIDAKVGPIQMKKNFKDHKDEETPLQEIIVIDDQLKPTTLTLWDEFTKNEGVAFSKLPTPFPIIIAMCISHSNTIKKIPLQRVQRIATTQSPPPTPYKLIQLKNLPTFVRQITRYWVNACATVTNINQKLCYVCCPNCNKSTAVELEDFFLCNFCKQRVQSQPRCKFEIDLIDESGKITATIFGSHAEKLFSITAEELMKNTSDDGQTSLEVLKKLSTTKNHILELSAYQYDFGGLSQCKFNILQCIKNASLCHQTPKTQIQKQSLHQLQRKHIKNYFQLNQVHH
ncbi:Replication protein A 70 kDa DNA-binding subunit D [Camellia lanceoleosa]|uniref:Replication protein A 70 kDa DNA-binding subunit D n=1 Tax=Camellia lanceoleosa TaxID=1840588 RepID=A0ACC0I0M5_9ERIC|nr:Replication protein A 70 kDa DNA-binding subunit D [Camellia lanceoleosa]